MAKEHHKWRSTDVHRYRFLDPDKAKRLLHGDFAFIFMKRTRISNMAFDRETQFTIWRNQVIASASRRFENPNRNDWYASKNLL